MDEDNSLLYMTLAHYTGLLQLCEMDIRKSLNDRLEKNVSKWRRESHTQLVIGCKLPALQKIEFIYWLKKIWDNSPIDILRN